jgi:hypothetical protein
MIIGEHTLPWIIIDCDFTARITTSLDKIDEIGQLGGQANSFGDSHLIVA